MRTCETMPDEDWLTVFEDRCFFYPGRDCPGWEAGGICGRVRRRIPPPAELVPWEPSVDD